MPAANRIVVCNLYAAITKSGCYPLGNGPFSHLWVQIEEECVSDRIQQLINQWTSIGEAPRDGPAQQQLNISRYQVAGEFWQGNRNPSQDLISAGAGEDDPISSLPSCILKLELLLDCNAICSRKKVNTVRTIM